MTIMLEMIVILSKNYSSKMILYFKTYVPYFLTIKI